MLPITLPSRKRGYCNCKGKLQMPMSDYYGKSTQKYFKASEFQKEITVTIKSIDKIEFENDGIKTPKPVLSFEETSQGFIVNKTNYKTLAIMFGDDPSEWVGSKIMLAPATTTYAGKPIAMISVKRPQRQKDGHPFNDQLTF